MKKLKYFILISVFIYALYILFAKHEVEIMFMNNTHEKVSKLTVYINGTFNSEFYCTPNMIPMDLISVYLPAGKHSIRVISSNPEFSWSSTFWVLSHEYYQFYFWDDLGIFKKLTIEFDRKFFRPLYQ